jgi:hypothetical protein
VLCPAAALPAGQEPDTAMMAVVLLGLAGLCLVLGASWAVWQARHRAAKAGMAVAARGRIFHTLATKMGWPGGGHTQGGSQGV